MAEEVSERAADTAVDEIRVTGLWGEMTAEFFGTFILIFFGDGAIAAAVWTGSYDLFGVGIMWGLAVALAVYAVGAVSGAHINPAVTISFAAYTDFPWRKVVPYTVAQTAGAFVAAAAIHAAFSGVLNAFERAENIVRGEPGSQLSAMIYTTYAPNPAIVGTDEAAFAQVPHTQWFASEVIITAVLVFGVMFLIEQLNAGRPLANIGPLMIGLLVAALVAYEAPVSMAALNPARDLGPRIWTFLAGWGEIAFPGPRNGFWIPTVSTLAGGLLGGALFTYVMKPLYPVAAEIGREPAEVVGE